MLKITAAAILIAVFITQASACSVFDPCRHTVHRARKAKPNLVIAKHEKMLAAHDRRLATHDAQFKAMAALIVKMRQQIANHEGR